MIKKSATEGFLIATFSVLVAAVMFGFGVLIYIGLSEATKPQAPSQLERLEKKLDEVHRMICGESK